MAMAEKLSIPQLQQAIQSGSLPAYIGVPIIEQKMKAQKQATSAQQPEQKPIAQEVMEQASGIDSVPSNLPVSGYNDGGIVAFAAGGDVDDFDYEEYLEQQEQDEYDDMLRRYMAEAEAAGIEGIPINRTKKVEQKYASGGIASFYNGGAVTPDVLERMREEDPEGYARVMREIPQPSSDFMRRTVDASGNLIGPRALTVEEQAGMNDPMADIGMGRTTNVIPPSSPAVTNTRATTTTPSPIGISDDEADRLAGTAFTPTRPSVASTTSAAPKAPAATSPVSPQPATTAARTERPRSAFEDFMEDIKASREDLKKQQAQDKYMAIMQAGLGMMAGTSPNAFANIGQGAQMGVASYAASGKQRAAERAALNKNLLMGQRYQSMEDIANRTADINEQRYRDAAAARAAGAGDGASLKQERLLDQREAALSRSIQQGQATVANALKSRFGDAGMLTNKAAYDQAYRELMAEYVTPYVMKRNQLDKQRFPDLFDSNSNPPASSSRSTVIKYDNKGNPIQ